MLLSFDALTALTISIILGILVLYVVVVYKKGWLRRNSKESTSYFLCPNPKCRRVFKEPIWLTDLSKTPPESYQACPNCSVNLQITSFSGMNESQELESTLKAASPSPLPFLGDFKKPGERPHFIQKENAPERVGVFREVPEPVFQTNTPKSQEKPLDFQKPRSFVQPQEVQREILSKPKEQPKKHEEKRLPESPRACPHFFGYVKTLPKNASIPDECLWCPMIVKCLAGAEKVEA